jgi:hypothetical protein
MSYQTQYFHDGEVFATFMRRKPLPKTRLDTVAEKIPIDATSAAILAINDSDTLVSAATRKR